MSIVPNALYLCNCLTLLERMGSGWVNLAYLDPPSTIEAAGFNTVRNDVNQDSFDEYLVFLAEPIQQLRRILSEDGILYLHSEPSWAGYLRIILDQIFGRNQFRTEIILPHRRIIASKGWHPKHETILVYSKSDNFILRTPMRSMSDDEIKNKFAQSDERGLFRLEDLTSPILRPNLVYDWHSVLPPAGRTWRYSRKKMVELEENNLLHISAPGNPPLRKVYLQEHAEIQINNVWDDVALSPRTREKTNFASQRSIKLLKRIITMSSNEGDLVIDPFCGSGTALIAAQMMGRGWIGCNISPDAYYLTIKRLDKEALVKDNKDYSVGDEIELESNYLAIEPTYSLISTTLNLSKLQTPRFILNEPVEIEETRHYEFKEVKGNNPLASIKSVSDQYAVAFLNSEGGRIFWGIRDNDRVVVGVKLFYNDRDELRRVVTEKLTNITPPIAPTAYRIEFHYVYDKGNPATDLYVVEMTVPRPATRSLYFTGKNETWVKTDGGKKKLLGPEIEQEILRRHNLQ